MEGGGHISPTLCPGHLPVEECPGQLFLDHTLGLVYLRCHHQGQFCCPVQLRCRAPLSLAGDGQG